MIPRILVVSGSTGGSPAAQVAAVAATELAVLGADVTRVSAEDHPLPLLGADPAADALLPESARRLADLIGAHDGVLFVTAELNASLPALTKNLVDWTGMVRAANGANPWLGKVTAIAALSERPQGVAGAAAHLRAVLHHLGAETAGEDTVIDLAGKGPGEDGRLPEAAATSLRALCRALDLAAKPARA